MAHIAQELIGRVHEIIQIDLGKLYPDLPEKGDLSDWLNMGHTVEELFELVGKASPLSQHHEPTPTPAPDPADDDRDDMPEWFTNVSLEPLVIDQEETPPDAGTHADNGRFNKHHPMLMRKTGTSELLKNHYNTVCIVERAYPGLVGYNEFRQRIEARLASSWRRVPGQWTEADTGEIGFYVSKWYDNFSLDALAAAVMTVAHRNTFNPAQDKLRALSEQWDGINRIDNWLIESLNAGHNASNGDYLRETGAAWIKGVAARVLFPGCKRDDVLVLRGPQGWMKSTAAQAIADCIHPDAFTDNLGDLSHKDARSGIRGIIIAELGELAALNKSDIESIKAFVAGRNDHFREAYGRGERDYPRTVSFIGTTNDSTFLKDPTGNRRWWPITITAPIDIPRLEVTLPQIIGEAARKVMNGETWFVKDAVALEQAEEVRVTHYADDVWTEAALDAAELLLEGQPIESRYVTIAAMMNAMGIRIEQQTVPASMRVGGILRVNKWESKRKREGGHRVVAWYPPKVSTSPCPPSK